MSEVGKGEVPVYHSCSGSNVLYVSVADGNVTPEELAKLPQQKFHNVKYGGEFIGVPVDLLQQLRGEPPMGQMAKSDPLCG